VAGERPTRFQSPSRGGHLRGAHAASAAYPIQPFQSPSRGGHLRGHAQVSAIRFLSCFSPLREGDTSVALNKKVETPTAGRFQSPSRGGHLRGCDWSPGSTAAIRFQSPSRGGHLRGLTGSGIGTMIMPFQSPSRGGHLRGGRGTAGRGTHGQVSVPFARGTPPWPHRDRGSVESLIVSVPFARGTPPWHDTFEIVPPNQTGFSPLREGDTSVARDRAAVPRVDPPFQSPSRGGHLRGAGLAGVAGWTPESFSPLREGDTSVARHPRGQPRPADQFQSPSRGGHLRGSR